MCPIVFQGHPSNFKVTRDKKSSILTQIGHFWTVTPVWIHWWLWNDAQSLKQHRRGALLLLKVTHQISRSHGTKNCWFWLELGVSGLELQFEFTDGFEMMHKAWHGIEEVLCLFSKVIHQISRSRPGDKKIIDFDLNWGFPDCNSRLNWPMALKWCTKLKVVQKRYPIVFQGHPSNFKVTQGKKSILTQIGRFRTVTPVWIHWWL